MQLIVGSSPHQKSARTVAGVMYGVIYGLVPATAASLYFFRSEALTVIVTCIAGCLFSEAVIARIQKKPFPLKDGSAFLTGLLLALTLPPGTQWYASLFGSVFAIAVAKHLFGGLGNNIFNPALAGRAFLAAAYPKMLTSWLMPFSLDAVTEATPLALRKFDHIMTSSRLLFTGAVPGCLGETSALCLLIGGVYIIVRKIADWRLPLSLFVTVSAIAFVMHRIDPLYGSVQFHLLSGGLMLGAFFMATDPVTTPTTKKGRFVFGAGCGIMIMAIRYLSGLPEGVMYSILFMNALVPLVNRFTRSRGFGAR